MYPEKPLVVLHRSLKSDGAGGESNSPLHGAPQVVHFGWDSVCPCTVVSLTTEKGITAEMLLLGRFACWHMSLSSHIWFLFFKETRFLSSVEARLPGTGINVLLTCSALLDLGHHV